MTKQRHVVVTGGAGFIGSHIASRLVAEGYKVTILDNLFTGKKENIPSSADFIEADLGERSIYSNLRNVNCDAVLHLAGQSSGEWSFKDPLYDLQSHVMSTFWLLEWCKKKGISRFMYASSMGVYGDPKYLPVDEVHPLQPKTFYAAGKASAEAYIKLYQSMGIDTTIFRLFSVYGPGQNMDNKLQGIVSIYLSYMLENAAITVRGSRERFRDLIYIDDVVETWMLSIQNPVSFGKTYNVATGLKTTVEDLIKTLKYSFSAPNYPVEYKDGTMGDQFGIVGDNSLIAKELKWKAKIDLQTGLKNMIDFEKTRLKVAH